MHPVPIYFHPLSMNARAASSNQIKNVTYVNEWLFVLCIIQVISGINKIIYFSAKIFEGRKFDGTERSTVYVERYGTEYGLSLTVRDGVRFGFCCAVRFLIRIFRPVSLSFIDSLPRLILSRLD